MNNEIGRGNSGMIEFTLNKLPSDTLTLLIYNKDNKIERLIKLN